MRMPQDSESIGGDHEDWLELCLLHRRGRDFPLEPVAVLLWPTYNSKLVFVIINYPGFILLVSAIIALVKSQRAITHKKNAR